MKKILLTILCAFLVFWVTGCKNKINVKDKSNIIVNNEDVILSVKEIDKNSGTFIIKNNSDKVYTYGPEYFLEIKKDNEWYEIELDEPLTWNAVIVTLKAKEETWFNIDFTMGYGTLKNGEYRLVKKISSEDTNKYISVEFMIIGKKETLKLDNLRIEELGINLEPNKPKSNNINLKYSNMEEYNGVYSNKKELNVFTDYISKTFNIKIDNRWKVFIHYYTEDKTLGMVEFMYTIDKINTNKCIIFNLENGTANTVYYKYLDNKVNEEELLNRIKLFESKYTQEKKKLKNDEKFLEEKTNYTYYYSVNKLVYSYNLFFSYGEHNVINNDYGTECIIDNKGNALKK